MSKALVDIYNLACGNVGSRSSISSVSEASREAEICNLFYPVVRDQILRAAPWASCRSSKNLAVQAERNFNLPFADTDPEQPWRFAYSLPSDFLYPRYLDTYQNFILGDINGTPLLYTDEATAVLTYTKRQEVPPAWDVDLYTAVAIGLSARIAKPLTGKAAMAEASMNDANRLIMQARANTANENHIAYDSLPEWLMARGAIVTNFPTQFIYQTGQLLSLNGAF